MKRLLISLVTAGALMGSAVAAYASAATSIGAASPAAANTSAPAAPAPAQATTGSSAASAPSVPTDPVGTAKGCVGGAVSLSAHFTQSLTPPEGFGDFFHDSGTGIVPGQAIQQFATDVCGKH